MDENPIMFDGKLPGREPRRGRWMWLYLLLMVAVAGIGWLVYQRRLSATAIVEPPPVAVVSDRPGGNVQQAEATRIVRRHLVERGVRNECIALKREAPFRFSAFDTCQNTRLGTFTVDAKTKRVR